MLRRCETKLYWHCSHFPVSLSLLTNKKNRDSVFQGPFLQAQLQPCNLREGVKEPSCPTLPDPQKDKDLQPCPGNLGGSLNADHFLDFHCSRQEKCCRLTIPILNLEFDRSTCPLSVFAITCAGFLTLRAFRQRSSTNARRVRIPVFDCSAAGACLVWV